MQHSFGEVFERAAKRGKITMRLSTKLVTAALVTTALGLSTAFAADPIETRKATMKAIGGAFGGVMVKMVKGEIPYDAKAAKDAYDTMVAKAKTIDIAAMFPKGSETGGETTASPKIWEDPAGFKVAMAKMADTLPGQADNVGKGLDGLKAAVGEIGKTCKGCLDTYRVEKK